MTPTKTVWVTKYALTTGIQEMEVEDTHYAGMVTTTQRWRQCFHGEGREWCSTREEACRVADAMRIKKIAALRKQIAKLEQLKF